MVFFILDSQPLPISSSILLQYHFFSAQAILALNYANGWSSPMRTRHRKFAHIFLNMCGIVCAIIGTAMIIEKVGMGDKMMKSPHGSTGIYIA